MVPISINEGFSNRPKHPQFVFPASGRGDDITSYPKSPDEDDDGDDHSDDDDDHDAAMTTTFVRKFFKK